MREGSRTWLIRAAWAGLFITGAMLVGLRIGRPVYYTDGEREIAGDELTAAGMLVWETPEVEVELPGPVQGRVAELPDGRLLYGRTVEDGTTDLVVFDPERPAVAPEPAYGLNTADNELAPACAPDGTIYFASDRASGVGGYDLYRATWNVRGFSRPVPVELCNTALDETDPAPAPDGVNFVFARVDREQRGGDHGELFRCSLATGVEPWPLFGESGPRRTVVDRDPAFSRDGGALWFLRKDVGQPVQLHRVSMLAGDVDEPSRIGAGWGVNRLRAPEPLRGGARLGLLQPRSPDSDAGASADLWFVSAAREVYPWWLGQRWLEWILLGLFLTCLLLLLLLHLGRRWTALDLVAQCLLLSLLLHILLFLWLMGVEITGALMDGNQDGGSLEVTVITAAMADSSTASDGQRLASVAATVRFQPTERSFDVSAPGAAAERAEASEIEAPDGGYESEAEAGEASAKAAVADAQEIVPQRAGADAAVSTQQTALPAVKANAAAAQAAAESALAAGASQAVRVSAPGTAVGPASSLRQLLTGGSAGQTAAPSARAVEVARPSANAAAPLAAANKRAAPAESEAAAAPDAASTALAGPATAAAQAAAAAERAAGTVDPVEQASAPSSAALARGGSQAELAPRSTSSSGSEPTPSAVRPGAAVALLDARAAADVPKPTAAEDAAAPTIQPLAAPVAGPRSPVALPTARAQRAASAAALEVAEYSPSSQLRRAPSKARGPQPSRSSRVARAAARPTATQRMALRDSAAATNASPRGAADRKAPRADAAAAPIRPVALALLPRANPFDRPQRAPRLGAFADPLPQVAAPGSLVERAAASLATRPAPVLAAKVTAYSNRFGPRKTKALERFGGTAATERAVADGLRYLAGIQNRDGSWGDTERFDRKYGFVYIGKSALCVLAFLGAGHTPSSETEYSGVVARALEHLLAQQDEDTGAFGASSCYGHGIATYALAECYGMTKDPALLRPLEDGLNWILANQGPRRDRRNRGGWGYFSPGLRADDSYARVSITSWMVMALESARLSGIKLPEATLPRAREYLEAAFDAPNGWFRYNHRPSRLRSGWPTLPASTPAAAFCLQLLGAPADHNMVQVALDYTVERRPRAYRRYRDDDFVLRGQGNVYFWYYGTLCCFLAGGEAWEDWNERLSTLLPEAQSADGSFAPIDVYAGDAGDNRNDRSYTTAMCVLSLEVYYRYFTPLLLGR